MCFSLVQNTPGENTQVRGGVGSLQGQTCTAGRALNDAPAECELTHQHPLQLLLPCLMSLGNLFLVFEEPLLCLSEFSDHCISEERKRSRTQLVRTLAWKSQAFFPSSAYLWPPAQSLTLKGLYAYHSCSCFGIYLQA